MVYLTISSKLDKLKEYVNYLKDYQKYSLEQIKNDHTICGAVLHYLQLSIECTMDIGELIISTLNLRKPENSTEIFEILAEKSVISVDFVKRFKPAVNFRNILVHEYLELDLDKAYSHLQNDLADLDLYAKSIAAYVKQKGLR